MKFAAKMTIAITLLLAVALSAVGTILVSHNFNTSRDAAIEQNLNQHSMERYSLEIQLDRTRNAGDLMRFIVSMDGYVGENQRMVAYYDDEQNEMYTNFAAYIPDGDRRILLDTVQNNYIVRRYGEEVVMLAVSYIEHPARTIWLLSGYNMSHIFIQRDEQLQTLWYVSGIVLLVSIVAVVLLSLLLTRPIGKLSRASNRIASGEFDVRTGVKTNDEIGSLAHNFDIMAAAVQTKVDDLNLSVQKRDDFVSAFAHELKTPMTSIVGYSDVLRSMELDTDTRHTAANHIYHESLRLEELSTRLLELMGLAEGEVTLSPVKLASIFAITTRSLQPLPEEIELNFEQCDGIFVSANQSLACDLLRNLILNAINATARRGKISILVNKTTEGCRITVQDTGCGIPKEDIDRVTEPFYMVDKSRARKAGGTGVGLALCQRIARLHGTRLEFESEVGVGTKVSFILQLAQEGSN